jgi:coproporphyrinogen III oxidase
VAESAVQRDLGGVSVGGKNGKSDGTMRLAQWLVIAGTACVLGTTAMAADDDRLRSLPPDQQALARRMDEFMQRMDDKYFARVADLNGGAGAPFEEFEHTTENNDYLVRVTRGPVVEKMGRMTALGKRMDPGRGSKVLRWGRFYSLDFHAATPLVGMLHSVVVLQFYADGTGFVGGWLGVMNGTRNAEDMARLKSLTDAHFARHDKDPAVFRRLIMQGTEDTVSEYRRRPDDSGVSFYGPQVFPEDVTRSWEFVSALFDQFVGAYADIIAKRASQSYTPQDVAAQAQMRRRWLLDQLFSDPFSSKLVPFEVWSLANVPPVIKF